MNKKTEDFEALLKEFTPKHPSHVARWNLDQRLRDLDTVPLTSKPRRPTPRLMWFAGAAAAALIVAITWTVATRPAAPAEVIATPDTPVKNIQPTAEPPIATPKLGPELVGDEKGVPSVITMKKHVTDMQDMGVVNQPNRPPMRQVRQEFINEFEIRDPDTGKTYRIHKPGSETIYIKLDDY